MNSKLYVTYDKVADSYGPIMEFPNLAAAIRAIGHQVQQNPHFQREDFQLFEVGSRKERVEKCFNSSEEVTFLDLLVFSDFNIYDFVDILPDVAAPQERGE